MAQKALYFPGADDRVTVPHSASLNLDGYTDSYTIEAWVKSSGPGSSRILEKFGSGRYPCSIQVSATECTFVLWDGTNAVFVPLGNIWNGNWRYIAFVVNYNTDELIGYLDGSPVGNPFANPVTATTANTADLIIGNKPAPGRNFVGIIDEMRFSNIARTPAEISATWNGGNGKKFEVDGDTVALWHMDEGADATIYDETDNNNDGTIEGASWVDGYPFTLTQPLSPTSILSAEAFGAPTVSPGGVSVAPSGISSEELLGLPKLNLFVTPSGIASVEAFGTPIVISGLTLYPSAIPSAEAFGSLVIAGPLIVPGIGSQEAFGSLTVSPGGVTVAPGGISSEELLGLPKLNLFITPSGIVTGEAFGAAQLNLKLLLTAIASGEQFGTATVKMILVIRPLGIASVEAFGIPMLIVILAKGTDMKLPPGIPGQTALPPGQTSIPSGRVSLPWE